MIHIELYGNAVNLHWRIQEFLKDKNYRDDCFVTTIEGDTFGIANESYKTTLIKLTIAKSNPHLKEILENLKSHKHHIMVLYYQDILKHKPSASPLNP